MRRPMRRPLVAAAAVLLLAVLTACTGNGPGGRGPAADDPPPAASPTAVPRLDKPVTLRVLGSDDLKDMGEVITAAAKATNVTLDIDYVGSLAGAQFVADGQTRGRYDAVWFASNAYLALTPGGTTRVTTSTPIMTSPVVLGLDAGVAKRLGWDRKAPTWDAIANAAAAKKFSYGMGDPSQSNGAFSALVTVASALSGQGEVLDTRQIDAVAPGLRRFFSAQALSAGSDTALASRFAKRAGKVGAPDGLVNYESSVLALNAGSQRKKPLSVVVPADGVISADFPLAQLEGVDAQAKSAYAAVTAWLRSPDGQQLIMDKTSRRPVVAGVKPAEKFGDRLLVELPFPAQRAVLRKLITSYQNSVRRATQTIYVLDLSGSMQGERIKALRSALVSLSGGGGKGSGGYAVFRERETVSLLGYASSPRTAQVFTIPANRSGATRARIRQAARDLDATNGNTATYSALRSAYELAARQTAAKPGALTSIVLMTDGETNRGIKAAEFRSFYRGLPRQVRAVPTFTVKLGSANAKALGGIADLTGGKLFTVKGTRLTGAFKEIRAYQ